MAAAEAYTTFQRGIIDAVALSVPDMAACRLYETGQFYTRIRLSHTVIHYCLNPRSFDALPEDLRGQLYNLYRVRGQVANRNFYGGEGLVSAIDTLVAGGVEIIDPTPDEREQWLDAVRPLKQRFVKENEALGLPAAAFVQEAKDRAAVYEGWTDQQLWDHVWANPTPGIIAL